VKEPKWVTLEAILAIHGQLVAEHGGSHLLRDRGLLESAPSAPKNHYSYGERDLCVLAAAYANGITRNHPFIDGNKRAAFMAAYTFLGINGVELRAQEDYVVKAVLGLSDRSVSVEEFTEWLRKNSQKQHSRKKTTKTASRRKRKS